MPNKPTYNNSHAIVIGINNYHFASPLGFAVSDAMAIAEVLEQQLGFDTSRITTLYDEEASKDAILNAFHGLSRTDADDKVLFFFAGHGWTKLGHKGQIGYLVPFDGSTDNPASLIPWTELRIGADGIPAKHVLFILDSCFSGLAFNRKLESGSTRFIHDMIRRHSRQVLAAGKKDQVVSDAGGPRNDHSVFTGHLLDALEGRAKNDDGFMTANGVMSYVYQKVASDIESEQTPHFGCIEGDGDFVFLPVTMEDPDSDPTKDNDQLVTIPGLPGAPETSTFELLDTIKGYIAAPDGRLRLNDALVKLTRKAISDTNVDLFPVSGAVSPETIADRLDRYNNAMEQLVAAEMVLGVWGQREHLPTIVLPVKRLAEQNVSSGGTIAWLGLRWYPVVLAIYSCGLGAVSSGNYESFAALLNTSIIDPKTRFGGTIRLLTHLYEEFVEVERVFKLLPGHERNYTATSEYLLKVLQPSADDALFLGKEYEDAFDRVEILIALESVYQTGGWGPVGRFGWKYSNRFGGEGPMASLIQEGKANGASWPPIKAGMFGGATENFDTAVKHFMPVIDRLGWL